MKNVMNKQKNIYRSVLTVAFLPLLLAMCSKSSDIGPVLHTKVDVTGTTIQADQSYTRFLFSTDGGTTWSDAPPFLAVGKKFKAQVLDDNNGLTLTPENFFAVDWSKSDPKPSDASSGTPEFTFADNTNLSVKVTDLHCAYDGSTWTGDWSSVEEDFTANGTPGSGSTDVVTVTVDSGTPNGFFMANYFGDGPSEVVSFTLTPSTTAYDQIVTIPEQTVNSGGVASGFGTYDQCRGLWQVHCKMVFAPDVYKWTYNFVRP